MCLIIDANKAADFVNHPEVPEHATIYDWLENQAGTLALGGKLSLELSSISAMRRYLRTLIQAGRAKQYPDDAVNSEEDVVDASGLCRSDDPHIIALARVSGARVLFSVDDPLCADFRNTRLVPRPPGKIYRRAQHRHLLLNGPACRGYSAPRRQPDRVA
jgi:hypothetical protein